MMTTNVLRRIRSAVLVVAGSTLFGCGAERIARVEDPSGPTGEPGTPTTPVTPPPRFQLDIFRGDGQWAEEGMSVSENIEVFVRDMERRPVTGRTITFRVIDGGGQLTDTAAVSDIEGRVVAPRWRLGDASRSQQLRVSIDSSAVIVRAYAFRVPETTEGEQRLLFVRDQTLHEVTPRDVAPRVIRQVPSGFEVVAISGDSLLALRNILTDVLCIENISSERRQCVQTSGYTSPWAFAWSPDGTQLVFHTRHAFCVPADEACYDDPYVTFSLDARTLALTPLLASGKRLETPRWSPDGSLLAFTRDGTLWLMRSNGEGLRQLPLPANVMAWDMRWSPNGRQIALTVYFQDRCPWLCDTGIGVINTNGSGFSLLTEVATWKEEYVSLPIWSPDGSRIAFRFESLESGGTYRSDVFVVSASGGPTSRILPRATLLNWR